MKALLTLVTAAALAYALFSYSIHVTANETPCKTFESAYNQVDPESRGSSAYGVALKGLVDRIEPDARNVAQGEVQNRMLAVVFSEARYRLSQLPDNALDATPVDARKNVNEAIAGVAKACKDSGYPISLPTDHTTS